ncbi:hypothetical protein [Blastopirellula marina]|uniref:Uncharacterized protein n=1 Tax=Blastopirellula marina TaxID=124 RepID=A0A2S8F4P6_9BACT|nr:hypothetical protein [Blastopirellula marina]PQO27136.1 hypothetical protein C5Y98_28220 [Blastopirellula marina]PTL41283.1 hypothetical protein C5Y97_28235 [Blastopirellula marina]
MKLPHNELDDPAFISLVGAFVTAYAKSTSATQIYLIHIDNWFGERWLGFAGKFRGIAGIRQRRGQLGINERTRSLATPPFRPSRVQAYAGYSRSADGTMQEYSVSPLHWEKNGGRIHTLLRDGLYSWYSGNTAHNTTGCLMVYELNPGGQDAWYLNFSTDTAGKWDVTSCRNTQLSECHAISSQHYNAIVG